MPVKKELIPKDVYKVKNIDGTKTKEIYVFYGKPVTKKEETMKSVFTLTELAEIKNDNINVIFSEQQIHFDDTIGTIKIKILAALGNSISFNEIYLFCNKLETLNAVSVYETLSQNNKIEITRNKLLQFTQNIISRENGEAFKIADTKDTYNYDDIVNMDINNKTFVLDKVLGQKFITTRTEIPFITNPFKVEGFDTFFERNVRKTLSTLNNSLLLNTGDVLDNTLYLCKAADVLLFHENSNNNGVPSDILLKIYYPFLYNKNIDTSEDLKTQQPELLEENSKLLNDKTINTFNTINMFYDVYNNRKSDLEYVSTGIKYIHFSLMPIFETKIPLDIIFKLLHSTENKPLIKYNPSKKQENIYRLFTNHLSTDGRKIPYLKKTNIFKLMKNVGKQKSVAIYIEYSVQTRKETMIMELYNNGIINVKSEFNDIIQIDELNALYNEVLNPIIKEIQNNLQQSGYKFTFFKSIYDANIDLIQLNYLSIIKISKPINFEKMKGCVSSIFNIEKIQLNTVQLRYKRVSNFNKVTSQEAFIIEKSEQGLRGEEIIQALLENFKEDITKTQAEDLMTKMANEYQVEKTAHKSATRIKDNPGFKTTFTTDTMSSTTVITMENINDINYLKCIPVYLDSIVRIIQNKKSTNYPVASIDRLCSLEVNDDIKVEDIVSINEMSNSDNSVSEKDYESEEEVVNFTKEKPKGALDLFFEEEDDEDEYEDQEGGVNTDDSDSSLATDVSSPKVAATAFNFLQPANDESDGSLATDVSSPKAAESLPPIESSAEPSIASLPPIESPTESSAEPSVASLPPIESPIAPIAPIMPIEPIVPVESDTPEKSSSDEVRNIDGMKLNKPYYFQKQIEKYDPVLILKEDSGKYNSYSRTCSSDTRRQPVILTDKQLEKINEEHEGFLREEDVIRYGSDPNKKFNYICPRFWCLKTNTFVDPNDLKEVVGPTGKTELEHPTCGKVLEKNAKVVKPGYYIYEFYQEKKTKATKNNIAIGDEVEVSIDNKLVNGKIKQIINKEHKCEVEFTNGNVGTYDIGDLKIPYKRYPNFQLDKHPDGHCVPCCFDKYNTEGRIKARQQCNQGLKTDVKDIESNDEEAESSKEEIKEPVAAQVVRKEDEYIKGPEKFPLDQGRWGYLPPEMQFILRQLNADCQISRTNTNIKDDHPCLLRHGVEISNKQSFIACISDALFFAKKHINEQREIVSDKILSIKEMRERIIKSLTIDNFITFQNGNLVNDFDNLTDESVVVDVNKYSESKLFSRINVENVDEQKYFKKVISALDNFKHFLSDDDAIIKHTYLWDLITSPNTFLFPTGINLVIFEIPRDDITNNVQLICPTNHYSSKFYDARKPTIILMKEGDYYEPIYSYTTGNKIKIIKEFREKDPALSRTMRDVINEVIKPFYSTICNPKESMPTIYKAKRAILLHDLVHKLEYYNYKILKLVLNFNNQVIGLYVEEPGEKTQRGFVPCYPGSIKDDIKDDPDFVFMTDLTIWNTYYNTLTFLLKLFNRGKIKGIPCKPILKVVEDEMVVGIITETNQFIQLSEPIMEEEVPKINDAELPSIRNNNYVVKSKTSPLKNVDVTLTTSTKVDKKRVDFIKRIKLENNFFNIFRNTVKILLSDYSNIKIRDDIETILSTGFMLYGEKMQNIDFQLKKLVGNKVQFIGDKRYYKIINEVTTCILNDINECSASNVCNAGDDNECSLIIPKKNLITNKRNMDVYFGKISDEIIRYSRIKGYMFEPKQYLTLGNIDYNLNDDEIIMLQTLLNNEYFDKLIPSTANKYVKYNSFDETNPIKTQPYDNVVTSLTEPESKNENCNKELKNKIVGLWSKCFPAKYKEHDYGNTINCTYSIIIDIIEKFNGIKKKHNEIKKDLVSEYNKYLSKYGDKIIDILIEEGKRNSGFKVKNREITFIDFILEESYYLTTFDYWLLFVRYEIPAMFISTTPILETNYEEQVFVCNGDTEDKFVFIVQSSLRGNAIPKYKLVEDRDSNCFIPITDIEDGCKSKIAQGFKNKTSIETYLDKFIKIPTKKTKKLKIEDNISSLEKIETSIINVEDFESKPLPKAKKTKTKKTLILEPDV
uniref:Uncharacterized protein n=1 Tax=viral metagenome TaxID=1070528 RepID=A0A6C0LK88_9ZZZZ